MSDPVKWSRANARDGDEAASIGRMYVEVAEIRDENGRTGRFTYWVEFQPREEFTSLDAVKVAAEAFARNAMSRHTEPAEEPVRHAATPLGGHGVLTMNSGQIGYEAYAKSTGGKTFDGRDMPTWAQVQERTPHIAKAWNDAAAEIAREASIDERIRRSMTDEIKGGLNFGEALHALKRWKRVARAGWNGRGMWIALTPGSEIPIEAARAGAAQHLAIAHEAEKRVLVSKADGSETPLPPEPIRIGAHIDMKAADWSLVIGWLASQSDLLAEDWYVLQCRRLTGTTQS